MSISGGLHLAFERLRQIGGEALQIFSRNQRQWRSRPLDPAGVERFRECWMRIGRIPVAIHASYLINLASDRPDESARSIGAIREEIQRAKALGVRFVIVHPGWHLGAGTRKGLRRCVENLRLALEGNETTDTMILLENTAGQGTSLGATFQELAFVLDHLPHQESVGICLDTCHMFSSGYDIRTKSGYEKTFREFREMIGAERLFFLHLNDSMFDLGSRRDRHEHIGRGRIGLKAFEWLINDPMFKDLPMVIETPKGRTLDEDMANLNLLRELVKED